ATFMIFSLWDETLAALNAQRHRVADVVFPLGHSVSAQLGQQAGQPAGSALDASHGHAARAALSTGTHGLRLGLSDRRVAHRMPVQRHDAFRAARALCTALTSARPPRW